jgi:hypothetical protein
MEPLLIILVPGLIGGLLLAVLMASGWLKAARRATDRPLAPPSPALINMARIRVDGLGGLGMVAVAIAVAVFEPRIRFAVALSILSGVVLAAVLIARGRRAGPLSSGDDHPGAHLLLPMPERPRTGLEADGRPASNSSTPPRSAERTGRLPAPTTA